jgi:hypothetical protein
MAATGTVPGTGRAAGTPPEAGPVAGMARAGRANGMCRANTPGMARRRVPAVNRSTAEADRQRRRRPIASTGRDRAASPTTDCKGRAHPAFLIREGQRSDPGGPVMSPQQLKPTSPRSIPAGVSCESKSTDCPGCDPERAYACRLRGRSLRPAALGRHALSAAPRRRYTRYPPRHGDDYTWYPPRHGGDQPRYHPRPPVPPMPPRPRRAPRPPFSEPIFCTQEYGRPRHSDCDDRRRPHRGGDQYYTTNQ